MSQFQVRLMRVCSMISIAICAFFILQLATLYVLGYTPHSPINGGLAIPAVIIGPIVVIAAAMHLYRVSHLLVSIPPKVSVQVKPRVQLEQRPTIPICTVCNKHPITSKHYQLCTPCKQVYNAEIQRVQSQRYRARQADTPCTLTVIEWLHTLQAFHFKCAYCQVRPFEVMEHIIPIKHRGGTTKENCTPACFICNAKKQAVHPEQVNRSKQ